MQDTSYSYENLFALVRPLRPYIIAVAAFSLIINVLMIAPAIYMLQVYDRAVSAQSIETLVALTLILVFLLISMGALDWVRGLIMVRAGARVELLLSDRVYISTFKQSMGTGAGGSCQHLSDLNGLRSFLGSPAIFAFFDAPWIPVYILIMFAFHSYFGVMALTSVAILVVITFLNQRSTWQDLSKAASEQSLSHDFVSRHLRNAEVIASMGMEPNTRRHWSRHSSRALLLQSHAAERSTFFMALSKSFRITMQSLALGLGAYLAINVEISPGMMIAGSILLGRALAPVDQLVAAWKGFLLAHGQAMRLNRLLLNTPTEDESMKLPMPLGELTVENIEVLPPGRDSAVLHCVSLHLAAGASMGVIGPSGSGKTSLARAILGMWPAASGCVRLDGSDILGWPREQLGPHVGYLPQDVELFDGTVAENIARLGTIDSKEVVKAATLAGVHQMILRLPSGYDTRIFANGGVLSGGQRQRIALARALYGGPKLVVLDEPNSNLDELGEAALGLALQELKTASVTVIVITHKPGILSLLDQILVLKSGSIADLGPSKIITRRYQRNPGRLHAPVVKGVWS